MLKKQRRRTHPEHKHPIFIAKRAGLGISGALNGAIATAYLMDAGVTFFDPVGVAAALMIFGWTGGFIGVTPTGSGPHPLQKGPQPEETLSAAGPSSPMRRRSLRRVCFSRTCRPQFRGQLRSASAGYSASRCRSPLASWRACARSIPRSRRG
jgi:hypothetical protein